MKKREKKNPTDTQVHEGGRKTTSAEDPLLPTYRIIVEQAVLLHLTV